MRVALKILLGLIVAPLYPLFLLGWALFAIGDEALTVYNNFRYQDRNTPRRRLWY